MITKVELKNYKSFADVTFDFHDKKKNYKKFVALYGENGSGKTNFVSFFDFFNKSLVSLSSEQLIYNLRSGITTNNLSEKVINELSKLIESKYFNMEYNFKDTHMIDAKENTIVKFSFIINGIEGYYLMEYNSRLVREELYYMRDSIKGSLFSITNDNNENISIKFYNKLFSNHSYEKIIEDSIKKLWGKHTFLSILFNEFKINNYNYIRDSINDNLFSAFLGLINISVSMKNSYKENDSDLSLDKDDTINLQLARLSFKKNNKDINKIIERNEKIINSFYKQIYSDIVNIHYELDNNDNGEIIRYSLFIDKIIAGKKRTIPFSNESTGTTKLISILEAIFDAINGKTVIIDEMDSNIHDLVMKNIIKDIDKEMEGQLIITTHNTVLMETLDASKIYLILVDPEGYKEVVCANEYKIQKNNNIRKMYLNGAFGGVPTLSDIDYDFAQINSKKETNE